MFPCKVTIRNGKAALMQKSKKEAPPNRVAAPAILLGHLSGRREFLDFLGGKL